MINNKIQAMPQIRKLERELTNSDAGQARSSVDDCGLLYLGKNYYFNLSRQELLRKNNGELKLVIQYNTNDAQIYTNERRLIQK